MEMEDLFLENKNSFSEIILLYAYVPVLWSKIVKSFHDSLLTNIFFFIPGKNNLFNCVSTLLMLRLSSNFIN